MKKFFYKHFNSKLKYIAAPVIAIAFFAFGYFFANSSNSNFLSSASASNSPLIIPGVFNEVRSAIDQNFVSWKTNYTLPGDMDKAYGMIKGYVASFNDPYTEFFTPKESKQFEENIKGSFGGIGAYIGYKDKSTVIISTLKDSPAKKAGILDGDIILSVNGKSTDGMSSDEVVSLVRGEIGTIVELEVFHKNAAKTEKIKITRAEVNVPILETETKNNAFIIHLYSFTENSAIKFEKALQEFNTSGKSNLVIDLRGNGGGYLESAIDISSFFLPKDKLIVVEKNGKTNDVNDYSRGYNYFANKNIKVIVLIDGGSASASEIVAGALKDNGVAKIVGEKSFGKGSVQQLIKLSDGSDIKVTVAKWFTPNGVNISESGITPDKVVEAPTKIEKDKNGKVIDTQLNKAIEIFINWNN